MTLSELIAAVGDDNVRFQRLDESATELDWNHKSGGRITFATSEVITPKGTEHFGLVLWLPRDALKKAINAGKE